MLIQTQEYSMSQHRRPRPFVHVLLLNKNMNVTTLLIQCTVIDCWPSLKLINTESFTSQNWCQITTETWRYTVVSTWNVTFTTTVIKYTIPLMSLRCYSSVMSIVHLVFWCCISKWWRWWWPWWGGGGGALQGPTQQLEDLLIKQEIRDRHDADLC